MFKVLVLAYYYPPMGLSGVQRVLKLTKYLPRYGWEPTVITTGKTGYYAHDVSLLKEAESANIRIIRTEAFDPNSILSSFGTVAMPREFIRKLLSRISKVFFIPDNKISWAKKAYKISADLVEKEKFDLIFVTVPPYSAFTTAKKLKAKYDIPLIVDYRDLWHKNHFRFNITPYHIYKHHKLEDKCLRAADKVLVINRRFKEEILQQYKFLSFKDIEILLHGYDPEDFESVDALPKNNNKLRLLYSGIFYEYISPKNFLKAFKLLTLERPDVAASYELHFAGILRRENQLLIKKLGITDYVREHGYLEHKQAIKHIKSADALWMMIGKNRDSDLISTGKLFEYFGSCKPILGIVPPGTASAALKEYGASYICDPDDVTGIKNEFIRLSEDFMGNRFPKANIEFIKKHDRNILTQQLVKLFQFHLKAEL